MFSDARKNGTTDGPLSQTKGMVTSYNNTVKGLNSTPTSLNRVYGQYDVNGAYLIALLGVGSRFSSWF